MLRQHYIIEKKKKEKLKSCDLDYTKLAGFGFLPRNVVKYDGIIVNKMIVVKPEMIEKVLRKKIKRKLDLYLKLIVKFIDTEDDDGSALRESLDDLSRYKSIVQYKYNKYLDDKYLKMLLKKIAILEYELNLKINSYNYELEEEKTTHRSR